MGCEIVRQENEEPGGRSRLCLRDDIFHVFTKNTGTEAIEGILLDLAELEEADWNLEAFSKMCKLKLLYIHNLRLSLGPKFLPNALRFLKWSWYPSKSLPPCFQPDELTELSLVHSNIDHLWNGIKYLRNLKSINLSYSINLTRTPDFTGIPNLEKLVLEGCTLPASIHLLSKLEYINVENCNRLQQLPELPANDDLCVVTDNCTSLQVIPDPPDLCRLWKFYLYSCNCLSTVGNQDASYFIYSVLKRFVEVGMMVHMPETPDSSHELRFVIPGREIPEWFNNQSVGNSVTEKLPSDACNSKWIGFAVCALIVPPDNPSAAPNSLTINFNCDWNNYGLPPGVTFSVTQIVPDHLILLVLLSHHFRKPENCLEDTCNEVKFVFGIFPGSQLKKCGARALYEHDVEELISKMNQSKSSSISLYEEAMDEQEGAMAKATRGSNKRKWCSDDEYYYSAEE